MVRLTGILTLSAFFFVFPPSSTFADQDGLFEDGFRAPAGPPGSSPPLTPEQKFRADIKGFWLSDRIRTGEQCAQYEFHFDIKEERIRSSSLSDRVSLVVIRYGDAACQEIESIGAPEILDGRFTLFGVEAANDVEPGSFLLSLSAHDCNNQGRVWDLLMRFGKNSDSLAIEGDYYQSVPASKFSNAILDRLSTPGPETIIDGIQIRAACGR